MIRELAQPQNAEEENNELKNKLREALLRGNYDSVNKIIDSGAISDLSSVFQEGLESNLSEGYISDAQEIINLAKEHNISLNLSSAFQRGLESNLSEGYISDVQAIINLAKEHNIPLDLQKEEVSSACQEGLENRLSDLSKGFISDTQDIINIINLAKEHNIPLDLQKEKVSSTCQEGLERRLSEKNIYNAQEIINFIQEHNIPLDLSSAFQRKLEYRLRKGYISDAQEIINLAKEHNIPLDLQKEEVSSAFQRILQSSFLSEGYISDAQKIINFAKEHNIPLDLISAFQRELERELVREDISRVQDIINFTKEHNIPLDLSSAFQRELKSDLIRGDISTAQKITNLAKEHNIPLDLQKEEVSSACQKELESNLIRGDIPTAQKIINLAKEHNIPLDLISAFQRELERELVREDISRVQDIINFTKEHNIPLDLSSAFQRELKSDLIRGDISTAQKITNLAKEHNIPLDLSLACQRGLEKRLSKGYISTAQKIINLAKEHNIPLDLQKEEVSSACQKELESDLIRGYISTAQKIINLAKEHNIPLDLQKEEVSSACQKELERKLRKGHFSDVQKIINLAKEHNISVDLSSACQRGLEKRLSKGYIPTAQKIINLAKKNNISVDLSSACQRGLENILCGGDISVTQKIINFAEEHNIPLDLSSAFQRGLESKLSKGDISTAQYIIYFAEEGNISLDFQRKEFSSACQRGLENRLSKGDISTAQYIINFAKEHKIPLDLRKEEVSSTCQEILERELSEGDIYAAQEISNLVKEHNIPLDLRKEEVSSTCQEILERELSEGDISSAQIITNLAKEHNIEIDIEKAWRVVKDKVKESFDLSSEEIESLSKQELMALISIKQIADKETSEKVKEFLDKREEIIEGKGKNFPLGKEYEIYNVSGLKKREDPYRAVILLIRGLISQKEEVLNKVYEVFEKEKIQNARALLQGLKGQGVFNPSAIYESLFKKDKKGKTKTKIVEILENPEEYQKLDPEQFRLTYDIVIDFLKEIIEKCQKEGIVSSEKLEPLSDLIASCEGLRTSLSSFDILVFKNQEVSIGDFFDNRSTRCCAFYPNGINREAAIDYVEDPYINLLWAKAAEAGKDGKLEEIENVGVAICCLCEDKKGKKVLLVDSVEGGEDFKRAGNKEQLFSRFLSSIEELARDTSVDYIVFNTSTYNQTPNDFVSFLQGLEEIGAERSIYLEKMGEKEKEYYLEAFGKGEWEIPKGNVDGLVLRLGEKVEEKEKEKAPKIRVNFERVNPDNISEESVNEILPIERASFPESLQSDSEDLLKTLRNKKGISVIIKNQETSEPVGYFSSLPLSDAYQELKDYDKELKREKGVLYAESIAFLPKIRGKGVFEKLFKFLVEEAKKQGYKKVSAHVRVENRLSDRLQSLGAKKIRRIENWYDSGEPFDYIEIEI